ncbi:hypothetical protein D6D10_08388 [Aureobasidium pullulans]|uniref:Uncharacterized protein n=1 Tax=Aureobasidium pullulans TaxID=5580 RepID=A0A4S9EB23_AURPU|nr:hypothetical protein D6D10_08388 [Aureobasidium pullulans]
MADHAKQTPEYFQAGLNAREVAHIYYDSERDTKYYVQHGTLPQELVIPAWDHLAIAADPKGPRSITELQDLRNISDYGSST